MSFLDGCALYTIFHIRTDIHLQFTIKPYVYSTFGFFQDICGKYYISRAIQNQLILFNMGIFQYSRRESRPMLPCRGRLSEMTENLIAILVLSPRIKQLNLKVHEIFHIPGHEDQLMLNGYRCDLGIGCGWGASGTIAVSHEAPPDRGRAAVERQDAPVELSGKVLFDPSLKSFATLLLPDLPSAPNELSDGLSGKEEIRRVLGFDPAEHRLPGSWPDGLTDNNCVEKKGHQPSSAERPVDLSRLVGSSASVRGEARRKATNSVPVFAPGAVSIGCSNRRINSASSPSERKAPAIALTRGASRKGTVTSTR